MDEYVQRQFLKEEEFLEVHYEMVDAVLQLLGPRWRPNYQCDDQVRDRCARLLATDQLAELTFDSAVLFHNRDGPSSICIYLHSSAWFVVVRVPLMEAEMRVEILADCELRRPVGR